MFADAYDGLRPNSAYADPFWLICGGSICIKKNPFFIQDVITLNRKWVPGHKSVLHVKVSLLQRENIKKNWRIVRHTDVISDNKLLKCQFMIPLKTIFALKPRQRDETIFKLCHCYCLSICLILTVFSYVGAKLHFRFHKVSAFWHASLLNKLCQIFERFLTKYVLSLTHTLSGILHKYESVAFRQLTRAQNTI